MNNLPYSCKELINLFAFDIKKYNKELIVFNKIIKYVPCIYSNLKIKNVDERIQERLRLIRRIKNAH